jgi:nicotinamide mononucleotide (NMN) deamidase PncC
VAISGVAGPEADEDGNAVGLVYVAGGSSDRPPPTVIQCNFGQRSREEIRDLSMDAALSLFETLLEA